MCDKEEKDMATTKATEKISNKSIPVTRCHQIENAIQEVNLIEQNILQKKSARSFLNELRENKQ